MLFAAFIMGLAGSVHCAAMCGPLALATPMAGSSKNSQLLSCLVYNSGRLLVYALLGLVFGIIGKSVLLAGLQQSLSLCAGCVILLFLLLGLCGVSSPLGKSSAVIRRLFRRF